MQIFTNFTAISSNFHPQQKKGKLPTSHLLQPDTVASVRTWRSSRGAGRIGLTRVQRYNFFRNNANFLQKTSKQRNHSHRQQYNQGYNFGELKNRGMRRLLTARQHKNAQPGKVKQSGLQQ